MGWLNGDCNSEYPHVRAPRGAGPATAAPRPAPLCRPRAHSRAGPRPATRATPRLARRSATSRRPTWPSPIFASSATARRAPRRARGPRPRSRRRRRRRPSHRRRRRRSKRRATDATCVDKRRRKGVIWWYPSRMVSFGHGMQVAKCARLQAPSKVLERQKKTTWLYNAREKGKRKRKRDRKCN